MIFYQESNIVFIITIFLYILQDSGDLFIVGITFLLCQVMLYTPLNSFWTYLGSEKNVKKFLFFQIFLYDTHDFGDYLQETLKLYFG